MPAEIRFMQFQHTPFDVSPEQQPRAAALQGEVSGRRNAAFVDLSRPAVQLVEKSPQPLIGLPGSLFPFGFRSDKISPVPRSAVSRCTVSKVLTIFGTDGSMEIDKTSPPFCGVLRFDLAIKSYSQGVGFVYPFLSGCKSALTLGNIRL